MKHKKKHIMILAAALVLVLSSCSVAKHDLSDGWIDIVAQGGEPPPPVIRFRPIPHLEYFEMTEEVKRKIQERRKYYAELKEAREAARLKYLITKYLEKDNGNENRRWQTLHQRKAGRPHKRRVRPDR